MLRLMYGAWMTDRSKCYWTQEEITHLQFHWGYRSIAKLSQDLSRGVHAITRKAQDLKLGPPSKRGMSINAFSRYSGFSITKIKKAAEFLGEPLRRSWSGDASRGNKGKTVRYLIELELQERLLEVMLEHEYIWLNRRGDSKSTRGAWGVGRKPPCCAACGTDERPHYAKGKCRSCYNKKYKKKRKNDERDSLVRPAHQEQPGAAGDEPDAISSGTSSPAAADQYDMGSYGGAVGWTDDGHRSVSNRQEAHPSSSKLRTASEAEVGNQERPQEGAG